MPSTTQAPPLPHWEAPPQDLQAATREIKAAIRARIEASGRTVEEVFAVVEAQIAARVAEIEDAKRRGETIWPVIDYADIEAGTVTPEAIEHLRRRGCVVIRGHFERDRALAWDQGIVDYVERNRFFEHYRGPADDFFGSVARARDLPRVLVAGTDGGAPERPHGAGPVLPELPVDVRVRGRAGSTPAIAVARPHPPSSAGRQLRRTWAPTTAPAARLWRPSATRGLPPPVRRVCRALPTLGRRTPHLWTAGPRHDQVLGLPDLPGLDRAVGSATSRAACTDSNPGGDGVPDAAAPAR